MLARLAIWLNARAGFLTLLLVIVVVLGTAVWLQRSVSRRPLLEGSVPRATALAGGPLAIKVHVVGAVLAPGVQTLAADDRVEQAIEAAGGFADTADIAAVNLAAPLWDGQRVSVPTARPAPTTRTTPASRPSASAPIDLNTATVAQLESLPGIGPVTARKILDHRARYGRFTSVEELRTAKLVGAATYEKLRDLVIVR